MKSNEFWSIIFQDSNSLKFQEKMILYPILDQLSLYIAIAAAEIFFEEKKTTKIWLSKYFVFLSKVKGDMKISTTDPDQGRTILLPTVLKEIILSGS